jgi:16S rRNA (cytidine1402-2'-O)-methyltransferase
MWESQDSSKKTKTLYLVATPIGHLDDLSLRAKEVLKTVDLIICEDTRHSQKLLFHLNIKKELISLHKDNEAKIVDSLFKKIQSYNSVALISDAGTPAISDPGSLLVRKAHEEGMKVLNVPGPSSLSCALASCGFLSPRTLFVGFLSRDKKEEAFQMWKKVAPCLVVFFESPKRVIETLEDIKASLGLVEVCVSKEISKIHENHYFGLISEVISRLTQAEKSDKGEYVVCVNLTPQNIESLEVEKALKEVATLMDLGLSHKNACQYVSEHYDVSKKELYKQTLKPDL